jgi:hypothetical protein
MEMELLLIRLSHWVIALGKAFTWLEQLRLSSNKGAEITTKKEGDN